RAPMTKPRARRAALAALSPETFTLNQARGDRTISTGPSTLKPGSSVARSTRCCRRGDPCAGATKTSNAATVTSPSERDERDMTDRDYNLSSNQATPPGSGRRRWASGLRVATVVRILERLDRSRLQPMTSGGKLKLLLTSGGVTNPSIHSALVQVLGKPIPECHALCVPTAQWGHPMCGPTSVRGFVAAEAAWQHLSGLGWASLGVLELTALPTIGAERWVPWVREADVLLADGGDATYLCHWMRDSGLAELLPSMHDTVWVGVSAGSMVMTPRIGAYFVEWPAAPDDRPLGVVDFSIFPHLDAFPHNTLADAERWAADIGVPAYAIDEQTAIKV